jgi:Predicted soluble lytic transglycosylase fused to an ABC-type amino acid-binding protein
MKHKGYIKYLVLLVISSFLIFYFTKRDSTKGTPRDYAEIKKSGVLKVVTEYNSLSYFVDSDSISGFQYEMAKAFAKSKGLRLDIVPEMSYDKKLEGLSEGKYDIIANDMLVTTEIKDSILLTSPIHLNKQVLIQRKAEYNNTRYIKSQLDLAHKILHVTKGSPSILRIRNLSNEIGEAIYIKEVEKYGAEQLMAMVAHGDISYAVCDASIAEASIDSFPQLDIHTDISFTQFYSWGVSKKSPVLLDSLNSWLKIFTKSKEYQRIFKKYYKD